MKATKLITILLMFIISTCASARSVLMVVTNHGTLGTTGKKTGYYLPEVSHPYYKLKKAGFEIVFASPKGGKAPMDPKSKDLTDPLNNNFFKNKKLMNQLNSTTALGSIDPDQYDAIIYWWPWNDVGLS
jgi:putative intracellular protease/amidase